MAPEGNGLTTVSGSTFTSLTKADVSRYVSLPLIRAQLVKHLGEWPFPRLQRRGLDLEEGAASGNSLTLTDDPPT